MLQHFYHIFLLTFVDRLTRTRRDLFAKNIWGQFSKSKGMLILPVEGTVNFPDHVPRVPPFLTIGFPGFWCRLALDGYRAHHAPKECVCGVTPFFLVFTHDHPVQPGSPHGCWDKLSSHLVRLQGSSPGEVLRAEVQELAGHQRLSPWPQTASFTMRRSSWG